MFICAEKKERVAPPRSPLDNTRMSPHLQAPHQCFGGACEQEKQPQTATHRSLRLRARGGSRECQVRAPCQPGREMDVLADRPTTRLLARRRRRRSVLKTRRATTVAGKVVAWLSVPDSAHRARKSVCPSFRSPRIDVVGECPSTSKPSKQGDTKGRGIPAFRERG